MGGLRPADPGTESLDPAKQGLALTVPHPEAQRRLFVLAPLADLAPGLVPPGWGETVATAAARRRVEEGEAAVRPIARWSGRWVPRLREPPRRQRGRADRAGDGSTRSRHRPWR